MITDTVTPINEDIFLPVINDYVAVPNLVDNKRLTLTQALVAIPTAKLVLMLGRKYLALPSFDRASQYPSDWYATLNAASSVI